MDRSVIVETWNQIQGFCMLHLCRFLRWLELSEEQWVWLDINIFNGAL